MFLDCVFGVRGWRKFKVEGKRRIEDDFYNLVKATEWRWCYFHSWEKLRRKLIKKCRKFCEDRERYINNKYLVYE